MPQHTFEEQQKRLRGQTLGETVTESQEFLRERGVAPSPVILRPETATRRLPGESITDLTKRMEPVPEVPETPEVPKLPQPPVVDSTARRVAERREEIEKQFGLIRPELPEITTLEDTERRRLAQRDVDAAQRELEGIFEERLGIEDELRRIQTRGIEGVDEAGRIRIVTEASREIRDKLDFLNRRELVLETKLSNRQNTISEIMKLQQQDFANATNQYNQEFSNAINLYNLVDKEGDELEKNAKATLKVLTDSIQNQLDSPDFNFEDIPQSTLRQLDELDLQSGYDIGFTQALLESFDQGEKESVRTTNDAGDVYVTSMKRDGTQSTKIIRGGAAPKAVPGVSGIALEPGIEQSLTLAISGLKFGSVAERNDAQSVISSLIGSKQIDLAKEQLLSYVRNSSSSTQQDVLDGKENSIRALNTIRDSLSEFISKGGNTNIFTGVSEKVLQKVGFTQSGELAEIANTIAIAIIDYRRAVSGAAFTESEAEAYEEVFPSIGKVPELNEAKINSLIDKFQTDKQVFVESRIGKQKYQDIFGSDAGSTANPRIQIPDIKLSDDEDSYITNWLRSTGLLR